MAIRMSKNLRANLLMTTFFFCTSSQVFSVEPSITRHTVNGFEVLLIDTAYGNTTKLIAHVNTGMLHDDPKTTAGRAHLLEHLMFTGSEQFPGKETFNQLMTEVGGTNNAATNGCRTFYHWSGHQKRLEQAMTYFGAMMSRPEWNETAFQSEREIVINEAKECLGQDLMVLYEIADWIFLPEGHPFKTYLIGSEEVLRGMTLADHKELFYGNYVPGSMQLLVTGNFSEAGGMNKDQVLADLREHFKVPTPYEFFNQEPLRVSKDLRIRHPFSSEAGKKPHLKMLKVEGGSRTLSVKFYSDFDARKLNHAAVETLRDLISLDIEGSFRRRLKEAELATSVNIDNEIVNNSLMTLINFDLHDNNQGSDAEIKVLKALSGFIKELQNVSLSKDLLDYLFERNVVSYEEIRVDARRIANIVMEQIDSGEDPAETLNFRDRFRVNAEDMKSTASALFPPFDHALIASMTMDLQDSDDRVYDNLFARNYQIVPDKDGAMVEILDSSPASDILSTIQIAKLPFKLIAPLYSKNSPEVAENEKPKTVEFNYPDTTVRLHTIPKLANVTVAMTFRFPVDNVKVDRNLSFKIFIASFKEQIGPVLDFAQANGHSIKLQDNVNSLVVTLNGSAEGILNLQTWLTKEMQAFQPTKQQIEKVLIDLRNEKADLCDDMTAHIAERTLSASLCGKGYPSLDEMLNALRPVSSAEIRAAFNALMSSTYLSIVAAGNINSHQLLKVASQARQSFPRTATREKTLGLEWFAEGPSLTAWHELLGSKTEDQLAIARAFKGPTVESPDYASFQILSQILHEMIFNENREVRALGYIQKAKLVFRNNQSFMLFGGQTDKDEARHLELLEGWSSVLKKIQETGIAEAQVAPQVRSFLDRFEVTPPHSWEFTDRLATEEKMGRHPGWTEELVQQVAKVTTDDVNAVFKKYLPQNAQFVQVIASKKIETAQKVEKSCSGVFQ